MAIANRDWIKELTIFYLLKPSTNKAFSVERYALTALSKLSNDYGPGYIHHHHRRGYHHHHHVIHRHRGFYLQQLLQ